MPKVEFVGQSSRDPSNVAAATGRLVNCYREPTDGRLVLRSVSGLAEFVSLGRVFMRAMRVIEGTLYAVCGGRLFSITQAGVVTDLGAVGDGEATIDGNYGLVTITAGGSYHVWDGETLVTIPVGDVEGGPDEWEVGSHAYLGGYTVISERGGRRLQWSALADAADLPGLSFASSETTDEPILRVLTFGDTLVVFKANSIERWLVTGQAGAEAFALITGSNYEAGLRSVGLVVSFPNGVAFVSSDGRIYAWNGGQLQPISTPAIESAMAVHEPLRCFFYEARGHGFICVTLRGAPAWCYDVATGDWHERCEGIDYGQWSAVASAKFAAQWVIGTDDGRIAVCTAIPRDLSGPLRRTAVSRTLHTGRRFTVPLMELFAEVGVDRTLEPRFLVDNGNLLEAVSNMYLSDEGHDSGPPTVQVRVSRDAITFGPEKTRSLGAQGRYETRLTFRAMGQFRRMAVEISMTAPVETPLYTDAEVQIA